MLTKETILAVLQEHKEQLSRELGVTRIGLFRSYAKGSIRPESDVDMLVDMHANITS